MGGQHLGFEGTGGFTFAIVGVRMMVREVVVGRTIVSNYWMVG